jgi:hypothetical protein
MKISTATTVWLVNGLRSIVILEMSPLCLGTRRILLAVVLDKRLLGIPDMVFDCCANGYDLAGDSYCGYYFCPTGFTFDGKICKELCKNGKALDDGKYVCPKGTTESLDGTCEKTPEPEKCELGTCSSGRESSKYNDERL